MKHELSTLIFRHVINDLKQWKGKSQRKPLIIRGARQVGKTTLVKYFGQAFDQFLYFNLEVHAERHIFDQAPDIDSLVQTIFLYHGLSFGKSSTLIFIDEIQESPKAIQYLRYFFEKYPQLFVIAAGSLLEHTLKNIKSFPVGRVEYLTLYPLNFPEFLDGLGKKELADLIQKIPVPEYAHEILKKSFHEYAIVGGMPEIVALYAKSKDISNIVPVYDSLIDGYMDDVEKYATNSTELNVIRHVIDTAPVLTDERVTLHNFGGSNYRSREVGEAMRSLQKARILYLIYPTLQTSPPPTPDKRKSPRLQFLDTGLVVYKLNNYVELLSLNELNETTRGKIAQHLVSQELQSIHTSPSYLNKFWARQKPGMAEVDLLYAKRDFLIPIEIKSGATGRLRSLFEFMKRCNHKYAIRMYGGKFSVQNVKLSAGKSFKLMNLPYYLGTQIPKYIDYLIANDPH